jgi:hypothetical protein
VPETIDHTVSDHRRLTANGIDPARVQPREHAVPCQLCRRDTFNIAAICDACRDAR